MQNKNFKIFIACAFGAGMGTIVALSVNQWFWWLGLIVGGLVGYLSYDLKEIAQAIPVAWKRATAWRPDVVYWKEFLSLYFWNFTAMVGIYSVAFPLTFLLLPIDEGGLTTFIVMNISFPMLIFLMSFPKKSLFRSFNEQIATQKKVFRESNIVRVYFYYLPKGIIWLIVHIPDGLKATVRGITTSISTVGKFLWHLFRLIHSEMRLLCLVDASIGTAIGYFFGSPIIGALAGSVLGVLNYQIVSIRILKVAPAKVSS